MPRETPREALRVVMERLADEVPRAELVALEKVAALLMDTLAKVGAAYARQFRPARR
ncbi:hypothetical protein NRP21_27785 [Roseomonas pecuniae]|uniref:Uncharacterized protein n=1 Tax=Roseomonas populi TaxID=3121582 RepID=A0ABT1XCJ8_9PROT|nr:hypothetical protein [Roseomonas pecuniae]